MTKNNKVNTKTEIVWPSDTYFTMADLFSKFPDFVEVTLRFRVNKALEKKELVKLGKIKPAIGRPQLVFSVANPSEEVIKKAKEAGMLPLDEAVSTKTVTVAELKSNGSNETESEVSKKASNNTVETKVSN